MKGLKYIHTPVNITFTQLDMSNLSCLNWALFLNLFSKTQKMNKFIDKDKSYLLRMPYSQFSHMEKFWKTLDISAEHGGTMEF